MTIPPLPPTQAISSTTFRLPILDGSVTLPEICEWHAQHNPDHNLFVFANEDGTKRTLSWSDVAQAVSTGSRIIDNFTGGAVGKVVAVLAAVDTISYFVLLMSIMRANCIAFPISVRNSPAAVAHLLREADVDYLVVGREGAMTDLAKNTFDLMPKEQNRPALLSAPLFEDFFNRKDPRKTAVPYMRKSDDVAMYLHTSGSTAFPKLIPCTHGRCIKYAIPAWFGERDMTGTVISIAVLPMYHSMSIMFLGWSTCCGVVLSTFAPKSPAQLPTLDGLLTSAQRTDSDLILAVPTFLEQVSRMPEAVRWLSTRKGLMYGGGPLQKQVGDFLISKGVPIFTLFGGTEFGTISMFLPARADYDWEYFKISDCIDVEMVLRGDNTYEPVVLANSYYHPNAINTKVKGRAGYATSDLFSPHPTKAGYWKVYGRADDQIMHSTGEKTNPGPLERIMNQHPKVLSSVMFGREHFQVGIIVDPRPEFKFDPDDTEKLAKFRNDLWPTVGKMNKYAPQHSRLFREMILVTKPTKLFTYTGKGTARRQAIIAEYAKEIDQLYDTVEENTQSGIAPPLNWKAETALAFVRGVVCQVLAKTSLKDDEDIFEHGCDSLQATTIRNCLLKGLRQTTKLDTRNQLPSFVYENPTVSRLATYLLQTVAAERVGEAESVGQCKVEAMLALVKKYSSGLPQCSPFAKPTSQSHVVLITGSTGSIGSQTLFALAMDPDVEHVYALNRKNAKLSSRDRQRRAFAERGLPYDVLESGRITLWDVDFAESRFGLEEGVYKEMELKVTHIVHNAWRVDFNLALASFESNIKTTRLLLDFAHGCARFQRFLFVSSIGVFQNTNALRHPIPEEPVSPDIAVGMGYSESKWVAEALLEQASKRAGIQSLVVRVGQVAGATNGAWNAKEWFPSLVEASARLSCLPGLEKDKVVSWVPLRTVAQAFLDLRHSSSQTGYVHLVHPTPTSWSSLTAILSSELSLDTVPYDAWLQKLESECSANPTKLNAGMLLPFFRAVGKSASGTDREGFGTPDLDSRCAVEGSKSLREAATLGEADIRSWIGYWRHVGILDP